MTRERNKRHHLYILNGHTPVPAINVMAWGNWMEQHNADRVVAFDQKDGVRISTVFLGMNHNFMDNGPPILFETMVFGGEQDGRQRRYATWDEAAAGHAELLREVFGVESVVVAAGGVRGGLKLVEGKKAEEK